MHRHELQDLGRYYHVYENNRLTPSQFNGYGSLFGIHVEINRMRICAICGNKEIENESEKIVPAEIDSPEYRDFIEELETDGVISESGMEEKYLQRLEYIKTMNQL
jgi:hypothetical protein